MKDKPNDVTDPGVERKCFKDLQESLLLAVKLELFTIPFYFYTFYSLKNRKVPRWNTLKEGNHGRDVTHGYC